MPSSWKIIGARIAASAFIAETPLKMTGSDVLVRLLPFVTLSVLTGASSAQVFLEPT